jgi:hypothetical protein
LGGGAGGFSMSPVSPGMRAREDVLALGNAGVATETLSGLDHGEFCNIRWTSFGFQSV